MLTPLTTADNRLWWRSPKLHALGVPHAFLSRAWNVQTADDARTGATAVGLNPGLVHLSTQCHGATVTTPESRHANAQASADAHLTHTPHELLAVRTADCIPVLLANENGQCVAAVHAGWRGLVAGVIQAAAHAMTLRNAPPAVAAIGPCIGVKHYEIGQDVAEQFPPTAIRHDLGPKPHLDLRRAALTQLTAAGLAPTAIDTSTTCTFAQQTHCFSYRRDGRSGHHAAMIAVGIEGAERLRG
ncbi:MAG: polyphenol oxidase family protein [Algisphaera sp.]